jgi:hypothetical protein
MTGTLKIYFALDFPEAIIVLLEELKMKSKYYN